MFPGRDVSESTTSQEAWLDSPGHDKTSQSILLQKQRLAGSSADTQTHSMQPWCFGNSSGTQQDEDRGQTRSQFQVRLQKSPVSTKKCCKTAWHCPTSAAGDLAKEAASGRKISAWSGSEQNPLEHSCLPFSSELFNLSFHSVFFNYLFIYGADANILALKSISFKSKKIC